MRRKLVALDDSPQLLLRQKLEDRLASPRLASPRLAMPPPPLPRHDTWVPCIPRYRLAGIESSALLLIGLEDERLIGAGPELLDAVLETWLSSTRSGAAPSREGPEPVCFSMKCRRFPAGMAFYAG